MFAFLNRAGRAGASQVCAGVGAAPAVIEGLEGRRLMSVTLSAGVLTVTGTAAADKVEFERDGDRIRVRDNGRDLRVSYAAVTKIVVNTLGGGDEIRFKDGGINKPTELNAGDGNDRVEGSAGPDLINGGNGHDRLEGRGGNDTINGGEGNDELRGGSGNDTLNGDAGNDRLEGDSGNDVLFGGAGDDDLKGGPGADQIRGGLGNDDFDDEDAASEILDRTAEDAGSNGI
jgi:Ca2+-binding RTX toxin-like protein